jgi:hypothetical protein
MRVHPWQPGEDTRYEACGRHAGALSRMDFEHAVDVAIDCPDCTVEFRGANDTEHPPSRCTRCRGPLEVDPAWACGAPAGGHWGTPPPPRCADPLCRSAAEGTIAR